MVVVDVVVDELQIWAHVGGAVVGIGPGYMQNVTAPEWQESPAADGGAQPQLYVPSQLLAVIRHSFAASNQRYVQLPPQEMPPPPPPLPPPPGAAVVVVVVGGESPQLQPVKIYGEMHGL